MGVSSSGRYEGEWEDGLFEGQGHAVDAGGVYKGQASKAYRARCGGGMVAVWSQYGGGRVRWCRTSHCAPLPLPFSNGVGVALCRLMPLLTARCA